MWGQAECDELAQRAEVLKDENSSLRAEVGRLRTEYEELLAQNASLKVTILIKITYNINNLIYKSYSYQYINISKLVKE